jgi:2-dehydro-3-deoxyphosphogalactonate aldolase
MPTIDQLLDAGAPPVVSILRGVTSAEVVEIGAALVAAGIRIIEVPLNSPDPFASIEA